MTQTTIHYWVEGQEFGSVSIKQHPTVFSGGSRALPIRAPPETEYDEAVMIWEFERDNLLYLLSLLSSLPALISSWLTTSWFVLSLTFTKLRPHSPGLHHFLSVSPRWFVRFDTMSFLRFSVVTFHAWLFSLFNLANLILLHVKLEEEGLAGWWFNTQQLFPQTGQYRGLDGGLTNALLCLYRTCF